MGANHPGEIELLSSIAEPDFGIITEGFILIEGFVADDGMLIPAPFPAIELSGLVAVVDESPASGFKAAMSTAKLLIIISPQRNTATNNAFRLFLAFIEYSFISMSFNLFAPQM